MFKELKKGEISKVESEYSKFFIEDKILEKSIDKGKEYFVFY